MLNWLWKLFDRKSRSPENQDAPDSGVEVSHDEATIRMSRLDGIPREIAWNDIACVTINTTGSGPFMTDLFWVLSVQGSRDMVVPLGAKGEHDLLKAMQRRLAGFDNLAVIEAIGSTGNASFLVWQPGAKD